MPGMFFRLRYGVSRGGRCGLLLLALLANVCRAEILENLYEVAIPVQDQGEKERHLALMAALDQVLVRASGQPLPTLQANAVVQSQRAKAEDYLVEYRYGTAKEGGQAKTAAVELTARFAPETIRQLLGQAGLPLWPRNRPTVMVWWQVEEKGRRQLAGDTLRTAAGQRGLPLLLPMGDLQDKLALDALWRFDEEAIAQVAQRYGVSAVLVGRATGSPATGWQGQWLFSFQGQPVLLPPAAEAGLPAPWLEGETLADLELAGLEGVIGTLLQYYGIDLASQTGQVELVVGGVHSFEDYSEVLRHVQALEAVRGVALLKAEQQTLHYRLQFDGRPEVLQELLSLGGLLVEESSAAIDPSLPPTGLAPVLRYRLRTQ